MFGRAKHVGARRCGGSVALCAACAASVWAQASPSASQGMPQAVYVAGSVVGAAIVGLLIMFAMNRRLRTLVRERTAELESKAAALAAEVEGRRAIEESQGRLARIIEATSDFVAMAETDGTVLYINRAGRALTGLGADEDVSGLKVRDLTPPVEFERLMAERVPAVEKAGSWSGQTALLTRDGREIPVSQAILAHRDAEGRLTHFSTIARDITSLKRTELTLRERERQLLTLMRNLPGMAYRCMNDEHWTMKFVSHGAYELTGYHPEELTNNHTVSYASLIHPDDRAQVWEAVQAAIEDHRPYQLLYRIRARDGGERWVWEHGRGVFTRRTARLVALEGFIADITQRRNAELAAGQMREYLQNLIDSMPSVVAGVDQEGRVTLWNAEAARVSGWTPQAAHGAPVGDLLPVLQGDTESIRAAIENRMPSKSTRTLYNGAASGRTFDVMIYPLTARGVNGAVVRVDDVTQRARIETMMAQTEKMLLVGGLAGGMAHEINNPLGGIAQACANILRRTSLERADNQRAARELGTSVEQVHEYLSQRGVFEFIGSVQEACQRASKIVADMLAFSRSGDTRMADVPLRELLDTVVRLAANDMDMRLPGGRRILLEAEDGDGAGSVPCDSPKIQQVLLNLVRNAVQALKEQGDSEVPRIVLRARRTPAYAEIEVEDNGPGMDEETQRRAFEPFFTTKEVGVGTGLGLSVSYFLIVDQHKGTIHVESQLGQGAKFVVRLPLAQA